MSDQTVKPSASVLFLLGVVAVLYRKVTRLWWTYDDPWNLHVSLVRRWTDAFTMADIWPQQFFTPLLIATYETMLRFAGLDPDHWYRIQLALLAICVVAVFFALRLYVDTVPALGGALVFAAGPPLCAFATQLMVVHYLEAILLGTLATIVYVLAFRRRSIGLEALSALLYFGAMLAKVVAAPLPLLLLFLPESTFRVRARHLLLHTIALGVYFVWRYKVIGTIFGGYGWAIGPGDIPQLLATLPLKIVLAFAGAGIGVGLVCVGLMSIGIARAVRTRQALLFAGVTLLFVVAPIVPVSKAMQPWYAVLPWLWFCVVFTLGVAKLTPNARYALLATAAVAVIVANRQEWRREYTSAMRMSSEARAFMTLDGTSLLRRPAIPPSSMPELRWLKEEHLQQARGAGWFYDDLYLCSSALTGKRIYEYLPSRREVAEVTARIPDLARAYCSSIRESAPLRVEFHHRDETLHWRFAPYRDGRWSVVVAGGMMAYDVRPADGFRLTGVPGLALRVRYESPEGWVTYSPEIALDFARQPDLVWHR
ncbi:MAG TPA: hypothetical protein VF883_10500 [Thermoanaerobaculia bacterium]